jgi:hypothetical protein
VLESISRIDGRIVIRIQGDDIDRVTAARHGVNVADMQHMVESALADLARVGRRAAEALTAPDAGDCRAPPSAPAPASPQRAGSFHVAPAALAM